MQTFAVIIGIDKYFYEQHLRGAAGDAERFAECLRSSLQVPMENMIVLLDAAATRDEILRSLHTHLRDNDRIHRGDAIVIYFAGHGTLYKTHASKPMEAIMPVDSGLELPDGTHVVDISDRQINLFLKELYHAKGENITVIMDCCYSAGCSRDGSSRHNLTVRSRPSLQSTHQDLIDAAEADQWKRWSPGSATDSVYRPFGQSHMLLAACRSNETAYEDGEKGLFTRKLLQMLNSHPLNSITYQEIQDYMNDPSVTYRQNPVVVGEHRTSHIFRIGHPLSSGSGVGTEIGDSTSSGSSTRSSIQEGTNAASSAPIHGSGSTSSSGMPSGPSADSKSGRSSSGSETEAAKRRARAVEVRLGRTQAEGHVAGRRRGVGVGKVAMAWEGQAPAPARQAPVRALPRPPLPATEGSRRRC